MPFTHIDLIGLNKHEMFDAPIVGNNDELVALAKVTKQSISIAGMRHSQGGHTALDDGRMVFTEAMKMDIHVDVEKMTVKVNAGATWSDLHFALATRGYAPIVHQSSAHFSIGGSLSVDCHGREVAKGPVSNTVKALTILTNENGKLEITETSPTHETNSDLFYAALGGYGACGVILDATLEITKNIKLQKKVDIVSNIDSLIPYLKSAADQLAYNDPAKQLQMFFAWLNTSSSNYLTESFVSQYCRSDDTKYVMASHELKDDKWGNTEVLSLAWEGSRNDRDIRKKLFSEIKNINIKYPVEEDILINYLREEIGFVGSQGGESDVDILQEYFIPIDKFKSFIETLRDEIFPYPHIPVVPVELLTCTLRILQAVKEEEGKLPLLKYSQNTPLVSVALEMKVQKSMTGTGYQITRDAIDTLKKATNAAIAVGGSYYLPYYKVAELNQFQEAYKNHEKWRAAANKWNPIIRETGNRLFNNEFLKEHL